MAVCRGYHEKYGESVIDLHTHLLPGLDDGARDIDGAVAMARAMAADGVTLVCGTPHVRNDYPTSPEAMDAALAAAREAISEAGIQIEVRGGGEIDLDRLHLMSPESRQRFGLGGNPNLLLLETPYVSWRLDLPRICAQLRRDGTMPVLAHPERNVYVQERPEILAEVVRAGAVVQITAASIDGRLGKAARACARSLLELELAHCMASDAHEPGVREAGMSAACEAVGDGEFAVWLTQNVPAALLAGDDLPERPPMRRISRLRRLRR